MHIVGAVGAPPSDPNAAAERCTYYRFFRINSPLAISLKTQRVSGDGLALVGCSIEQDAAYWEWQIERTSGGGSADDGDDDDDNAPKFGVATRKDQKFYRALQAAEIDGELPS